MILNGNMNGKINKTIKSKEEIKKHQVEIGAVADCIVGFETIQKNIEQFKKKVLLKNIKY